MNILKFLLVFLSFTHVCVHTLEPTTASAGISIMDIFALSLSVVTFDSVDKSSTNFEAFTQSPPKSPMQVGKWIRQSASHTERAPQEKLLCVALHTHTHYIYTIVPRIQKSCNSEKVRWWEKRHSKADIFPLCTGRTIVLLGNENEDRESPSWKWALLLSARRPRPLFSDDFVTRCRYA